MLRHENIDRMCLIIFASVLLMTLLFLILAAAGLIGEETGMDYEARLFDQSLVHTIDITMDDWDSFLETATSEEYADCQITIDGEVYKNVAIRAKGNTSLSSVKEYGNNRYSFKVEFDHYQSGMTYHGLDKLSLNNLIQDNTYLKDYTAYTLMGKMDVAAPLCSFVQINVNGEPWGLYLAVEGIEDSFLTRNYGKDHGELYKPDSMSFGGGRGNGREFDADKIMEQFSDQDGEVPQMPNMPQMPSVEDMPDIGDMSQMPQDGQMPDFENMPNPFAEDGKEPEGGKDGGPTGGMGSNDVKLIYTDDNPESYTNIFNNAKTDISEADQARLIASLKMLNEGDTSVIDTDAVIRYLVVHNFMCNDDSYTGMMVHNYYLYEEDGRLSMIPWDYNLSLGGFSMGGRGTSSGATSIVNSPIDSPVSGGSIASRPMVSWIFSDEQYTKQYHDVYAEFLDAVFASGWFETHMRSVMDMIAPYVQRDKNGFFSYDEFVQGCDTLLEFCSLRAQSITGQLDGSIPSTTEGQRMDASALIDASHLELSDMGEFGIGGGGFPGGPGEDGFERPGSSGASRRGGKRGERNPAAEEGTDQTPSSETGTDKRDFDRSKMPDSFGGFPGRPDGKASDTARDSSGATMLALCIASLLAAMVCVKRCKPHQ